MPEPGGGESQTRARGYWRANTRLQIALLLVWALVGYVLAILLAEPLNGITIGGFPLGFWMAQQGAIVVFVVLIFVYAFVMDHVDHEYDVHEEELGSARRRLERRKQRRAGNEQ